MNRRNFISGFGKLGLTAATATAVTTAVCRGRDLAENSVDGMAAQLSSMKKRLDSLEGNQKKMLKLLCIFAVVSTGIDISILM